MQAKEKYQRTIARVAEHRENKDTVSRKMVLGGDGWSCLLLASISSRTETYRFTFSVLCTCDTR